MSRKKKHGDHENHERWLLTYADMITLLVAFFIMLYAMSVTNTAKFVKLALSVRSGFGNVTGNQPSILNGMGGGSPLPAVSPITPVVKPTDPKKIENGGSSNPNSKKTSQSEISEQIKKAIEREKLADHVQIRDEERGVVVSVIADQYTFDSGSAALKAPLMPILDKISHVLKPLPNMVRVEGHTDNLPISTDRFPSNWQLSAERASNVLCHFVASDDVSPDRINCVGYGDRRPILPNTTPENRAKNRRVEIVILKSKPTGKILNEDF
ncbi:MAG TPA: OmpA family protein [Capsulimonadaceae bacterium]|jgi:chemotaxis protein MotB